MKFPERFLTNLDSWRWSAVSRMALGLVIPPVFGALSRHRDRLRAYRLSGTNLLGLYNCGTYPKCATSTKADTEI
jgi:hypothetical protein